MEIVFVLKTNFMFYLKEVSMKRKNLTKSVGLLFSIMGLLVGCGGQGSTSTPETTSEEPTSVLPSSSEEETSLPLTSEELTSEEETSEEPSEEETSEEATSEEETSEEISNEEETSEEPSEEETSEEPHTHTLERAGAYLNSDGGYDFPCEECEEKAKLELKDLDLELNYSGNQWGNWQIEGTNTLKGLNRTVGDQHWVSSISVADDEDLILDFDVTATSDNADFAMNIGIGIAATNDPGATWMGLNLSKIGVSGTNARVFGKDSNQDKNKASLVDYRADGHTSYHVRIEALANHWISYYVDGNPIAIFESASYNGGYFSFCTWCADVTWSNIRYYVGKGFPLTPGIYSSNEGETYVSMDMSDFKWGSWNLDQENTMVRGYGAAGDVFYVSNVRVEKTDEFVYECDIKSSDTCGIVFGVQAQNDPGASWICQNINWDSSKAFCVGGNNPVTDFGPEHYELYEHKSIGSIRHVKITVTNIENNGNHFKFEVCGFTVHEVDTYTYIGGYLAVMAWMGDSWFINPTITYPNK